MVVLNGLDQVPSLMTAVRIFLVG